MALRRRGKRPFDLEDGGTLLVHLGMTGHLLLRPERMPNLPHVHLSFQLEGGHNLIYQDVRRFGQVLVFPPGTTPPPLAEVGREPFSRERPPSGWGPRPGAAPGPSRPSSWTPGYWPGSATSTPAKSCSPRLSIQPPRRGGLSAEAWDRLLRETRRILRAAIRQGGSSVDNYVNCLGEAGRFQFQHLVYGKEGEPCRSCGATIARIIQAGRSTFFCPECQKNLA